jgi:hypothetical protein
MSRPYAAAPQLSSKTLSRDDHVLRVHDRDTGRVARNVLSTYSLSLENMKCRP